MTETRNDRSAAVHDTSVTTLAGVSTALLAALVVIITQELDLTRAGKVLLFLSLLGAVGGLLGALFAGRQERPRSVRGEIGAAVIVGRCSAAMGLLSLLVFGSLWMLGA